MYYALSTTHMKQIIKPDKGKGAYLNSREASLGTFFVWCILTGIATITITSMLGTDVTKLIQTPTQPTQPLKP